MNMHLKEARELPIYNFVEKVSKIFGRLNHNNRQLGSFTYTPICQRYNELLMKNEKNTSTRESIVKIHNFNDFSKYISI